MSKRMFARKYDWNMEQLLENGKKSTIDTHFWLSFLQNESDMKIIQLKMKVKSITLLNDLKHTMWHSLVNIL